MKKRIIVIMVIMMIAAVFVGCAQRDESPQPTVTTVPTEGATPTVYPDDDVNTSPTIGQDGLMGSPTPVVSPTVTPAATPVTSPSPNVD